MNLLATGARTSRTYSGKHRACEMDKGIGHLPLGDRNRVRSNQIHLVGVAEESDGVDRFDKWSKIPN